MDFGLTNIPGGFPGTHTLLTRDFLLALWEAAADAMVASDPDGRVLAANAAYYALYGLTPDQVLGQDFAIIFPEHARASAREQYRALFSAPELLPIGDSIVMRPDGAEAKVAARYTFIEQDGVRIAMLSIIRDVTVIRQLRAERAAALEAERLARARAEDALAARNTLLASLSHDLQTPLTVIRGEAQLLLRHLAQAPEPLLTRSSEALGRIDRTVGRMSGLLADLIEGVRLEAGESLLLRQKSTDLGALVAACVEETQRTIPDLLIGFEPGLRPLVGWWDAERLERVVNNLLSNATKYRRTGGRIDVRLSAGAAPGSGAAIATLVVADEGVGIPAADLPLVFERFRRAQNVGRIPGSGLGLSGAKQIVEHHGGTIAIESEEGVGTTVTVQLPLTPVPEA